MEVKELEAYIRQVEIEQRRREGYTTRLPVTRSDESPIKRIQETVAKSIFETRAALKTPSTSKPRRKKTLLLLK